MTTDAQDLGQTMSRHVLTRLGLQVVTGDHLRFDLLLDDAHLDADGHIDVGVLGTYIDMTSSQPREMQAGRPFVHADISFHRLARPEGARLSADARALRLGKRTGVIEIEVHDDAGVHVARSVQGIAFPSGAPTLRRSHADEVEDRFFTQFHGECTLDGPFRDVVGISGPHGDGPDAWWEIALSDVNVNGFGGLHGGVATALVDAAATGAVRVAGHEPAGALSLAVRYLAPSLAGPIRARGRVTGRVGDVAVVAVEVRDADENLTILSDVHVATR
ncbi:hotdog domain-containing protein [Actinomarinicola tropica]|uniref:Thioesterase domain-containing protein n=1 Tax=Actinomarinicola tropica TaxID=2789776 RepID=A0A5Q2R9X4_9ACTN|nr:hotdog domain-containing protein [Actinomarinicola tropica]QGG93689.1 hypothetical protein GH723_00380 [Actinomarinicola tropica]